MKLVAMLRVKDAEDTLDGCLVSLERFVDEVVVVDNGSTDGTFDIYRDHPSVVYVGRSQGYDEARDKNQVLEYAVLRNPDWIVWIDADEEFDERFDRAAAERAMTQTYFTSVWFKLYHFWRNKTDVRVDGRWAPTFQRMMWKNTPLACWGDAAIHNGFIQRVEGDAFGSRVAIKHFGHITEKKTTDKQTLYRGIDNQDTEGWTGRDYDHMTDVSTLKLKPWDDLVW